MKRLYLLIILLLAPLASAEATRPAPLVKINNAVIGLPANVAFGERVDILYEWPLCFSANGANRINEMPNRAAVEKAAKDAAAAGHLLIFDFECWPLVKGGFDGPGWSDRYDDAWAQTIIDRWVTVLGWAKTAAPGVKLGAYSLGTMGSNQQNWVNRNSAFWLNRLALAARVRSDARLHDLLDVICPVLYPEAPGNPNVPKGTTPEVWWNAWATNEIASARDWNKPIMPFVSLRYWGDGDPITASLAETILGVCARQSVDPIFWHDEKRGATTGLPGYAAVRRRLP